MMKSTRAPHLPALALAALLAAAPLASHAADSLTQRYQAERSACDRLTDDTRRAACIRESGAALQAAQSGNQTLTQPSDAQARANALRRCDRLPEAQRASCVQLRSSPSVESQGSVDGGGVFRTLTIRETGAPVPATPSLPPAGAPAVSPLPR